MPSQVQTDKDPSLEFLFNNIDFMFVWKIVMMKYHLRGRPHDPVAMFKALLFKEMRQLSSRRKLVESLKRDSFWLRKCGFQNPPSHNSFSDFVDRVGADATEQLFYYLVGRIRELKNIGELIAVDSTPLKGYAHFWKNRKCSDPDAKWGYSPTTEWVFGYKVHIAVDAESELPLAFTVTPANIFDNKEYPKILEIVTQKGIRPKIVLADAGYDSKESYRLALNYGAVPIIAINKRNLKKKNTRDFEKDLPVQRNSEIWKSLYRKRSSAERVISRLKEELALKDLKVRGLDNVRIHVAFSLIAMLTVALVAFKTGNGHRATSVNSFRF
jgi:transposase